MNSIVSVSGNSGTTVTINGRTYNLPSGSVSVVDGKIYHNGKLVDDYSDKKETTYNVVISGDNNNISVQSGDVKVNGSAGSVTTQSGDVEIACEVNGDVKTTSGDINIKGNVYGRCSTVSGDINAKRIDENGVTKGTTTGNFFDKLSNLFT